MKMPWHNRTGLAKGAIICATGLGISTGLCGLNAILVPTKGGYPTGLLIVTAYLEASAMAVFGFALLLIGFFAIVDAVGKLFSRKAEKPQ